METITATTADDHAKVSEASESPPIMAVFEQSLTSAGADTLRAAVEEAHLRPLTIIDRAPGLRLYQFVDGRWSPLDNPGKA